MPRKSVFQCPVSKKLYADPLDYKRELSRKNFQKFLDRRRQKLEAECDDLFKEMRRATDFEQIAQWIMDNQQVFLAKNPPHRLKSRRRTPFGIRNVQFTRMRWDGRISATHNVPLGKRTNWHRVSTLPTHYAGFRGTIHFEVQGPDSGADLFRGTGISTGGGGCGSDRKYSYEVYLFADDWTSMTMARELCL